MSHIISTLYNVCAVPWGVLSTVGGYHDKCGGYLEYRRGVQFRDGYHEYCGRCSVPWGDIMINVGDILSTVGVFSSVGEYHEYHGGLS